MTKLNLPDIKLDDFDYDLPKERIALYPVDKRGNSKLILTDAGTKKISHHVFVEIPSLLPENSMLVMNETKVIAARLPMRKSTGGKAEILCVEPLRNEPQNAMQEKKESVWKCIAGGKKIRPGNTLYYEDQSRISLKAEIINKDGTDAIVKFIWKPEELTFAGVLEIIGKTPLPPYIKREAEDSDKIRYQTVYANSEGSVAAPTAGLHFTDEILRELEMTGITQEKLTLHVGPGTFVPVEGNVRNHKMHSERIHISAETLKNIKLAVSERKKIICTGTTAVRTLESLYWFGAMILENNTSFSNEILYLEQWEPYKIREKLCSVPDALQAVIKHSAEQGYFSANTSLFILPGYSFKLTSGLITNFHLPKSTLILLVSAFAGDRLWRETYRNALENDYRFLSYGDACLFLA